MNIGVGEGVAGTGKSPTSRETGKKGLTTDNTDAKKVEADQNGSGGNEKQGELTPEIEVPDSLLEAGDQRGGQRSGKHTRMVAEERSLAVRSGVIRKIENRNYPAKKGGITAAQPGGKREILL